MSDAPLYNPVGNRVDFDLRLPAPLAGDQVDFDLGRDGGGGEQPTPVISPGSVRLPWGRLRPVDRCIRLPWRSTRPVSPPQTRLAWGDAQAVPCPPTRLSWRTARPVDTAQTRLAWGDARPVPTLSIRLPWRGVLRHLSRDVRLPWADPWPRDQQLRIAWAGRLSHLDFNTRLPWGRLDPRDRITRITWWAWKPPKDHDFRIFWGRALYDRICRRAYEPPPGNRVDFNLWEPLSRIGDHDHVDFWLDPLAYDLRCEQREPSGWRDNYFYHPGKYPKTGKDKVIVVINTAYLTRVSDGKPIEVYSMGLSADIDSWCWSFDAKVPESSIDLVMPLDEPVAVEADINGYKWRVLIESWSESHAFARREYTIRGRSLSAYLAEPYAAATAGSNEASANARQLAEEQLEYTDWALQWDIVDWLVGPGALSYSNATPLKIIQQIAEAAGGRVQSHRTDQQLIVIPRLLDVPWDWGNITPALGINDWVVRQLSREFDSRVSYNAVFVSGENQGVLCKVFRSGTEGNEFAPMVTDALITAVEPARERGKLVIGQSGKWSKERLEMPLTRSGSLPGLLEIGSLISMEERGRVWRGQVVGVSINVEFGKTTQNVDVERYRGK